uniref:Immunoglobulin V-set domain-containing protein n=1 Tax=Pongo abelii TaxID=9601 RepID=A0A8I5TRP8_PONAB
QYALTWPPFVSGAPGQLVTTSCTGTSSDVGDYDRVFWYQKHPGTTSRLLIYNVNTRPSEISDLFSGSKSGNMVEANYHCSLYSSSYTFCSGPSSWGN